eukprot:g3044.t2
MANYAIVFTAKGDELKQLVTYFKTRLKKEDCEVREIEGNDEALAVSVSYDRLLIEASKAKLTKKTLEGEFEDFDIRKKASFEGADKEDFLLPFEKHYLLGLLLDRLEICEDFKALCKKLGKRIHLLAESESLILICKRLELVEYMTPIHNSRQLQLLWDSAKRRLFSPLKEVRGYFGEQVAYYYAWLNFYTACLSVPALVGALVYILNSNQGIIITHSPYVPFFSIFMILWAGIFLKLWRRRGVELSHKWDTLDLEKKEVSRPEFRGMLRKSPITGMNELYYPYSYRFAKCCVSVLVTLCLLCVAFGVMTVSLNLQGYVHKDSTFFYIPYIEKYVQPGEIFDPTNSVLHYIPVLLHVLTIQVLNRNYRKVAEVLTDWENHRTEQAHESSLILKRFFFDAFDSYIALFYLAFVERDVLKVRLELTSLYMVDCLRRLATEIILPYITQYFSKRKILETMKEKKTAKGEKPEFEREVLDMSLDVYEEFDDYLEMIIAYGYITMFASVVPFAAFVQMIYNFIELKSDTFKLCFVVQRPRVVRENGIGSWRRVMQLQVSHPMSI